MWMGSWSRRSGRERFVRGSRTVRSRGKAMAGVGRSSSLAQLPHSGDAHAHWTASSADSAGLWVPSSRVHFQTAGIT